MTTDDRTAPHRLRRDVAQQAVATRGWRLVLGQLRCTVDVPDLTTAVGILGRLTALDGDLSAHLDVEVRPGALHLGLRTPAIHAPGQRDVDLALAISDALAAEGFATTPGDAVAVQALEVAIDAMDVGAVRPFWAAVLGYVDQPGEDPPNGLIDPHGRGPAFWFQQMDAPRPQRNRIHLDVDVPHDVADARISAAVAAGGKVIGDDLAPAFWVLADPEGNEACICTWQNRDDREGG